MKFLRQIKEVDKFGAIFSLFVQGNSDVKYKSFFGALATIIIYATSLSYFIYLMILWSTDQIPPRIVSQSKFMKEGSSIELSMSPFQFNLEAFNKDVLNRTKSKKYYIINTDHWYDWTYHTTENVSLNCTNIKPPHLLDLDNPLCVDLTFEDQKNLSQTYEDEKYLGFELSPCDISDPDCMNEEDEIFSDNIGKITTLTQEYDYASGELLTMPRQHYFPLTTKLYKSLYLDLTITRMTITRGIIFPTTITKYFVSNVNLDSQVTVRNKGQFYASFWISLEKVELEIKVEYPRLPEVLAQFATIFNTLLTFGIFIGIINNHLMQKKLVTDLGEIYFFNYKEIANLSKQTTRNQIVDSKSFLSKELLKHIQSELLQKFNIINLVYEVSKLQFAIQTILNSVQIKEIQRMKYKIIEPSQNQFKNKILCQKEFFIFSQIFQNFSDDSSLMNKLSPKYNLYKRVNKVINNNMDQNLPLQNKLKGNSFEVINSNNN